MPLFLVQDDDRPMYVLAEDWSAALTEWRDKIADENDEDGIQEEPYNPRGISLVAEDNDILIERKIRRMFYQRQADSRWEAANKRGSDTSDAVREGLGERIERQVMQNTSKPPEVGVNDPPINSPIKCPNCESMSYYTDGHHQLFCSVCQYTAPSPK